MSYERNEACLGVLPGTFIACGEFGYCSNECLILGAFERGAAVAFGIIGMAEVIRQSQTCWAACGATLIENKWGRKVCPNCG